MPTVKEQVRELLDRLPKNCTFDDVQYALYTVETLANRIKQAEAGDFVPHDQMKARLQQWLSKRPR